MKNSLIPLSVFVFALPLAAHAAPEGVAPEVWAQLAPQVERAAYGFREASGTATARNRAQDFALAADRAGLAVDGALRLKAAALNGEPLPEAEPTTSGGRVEYRRGAVVEWFENRAEGLEQGFTIGNPPVTISNDQGMLNLEVSFETELDIQVAEDGQAVTLSDEQGAEKYRYGKLQVFDADGKMLDSFFRAEAGTIEIVCDASRARFPVTIDPVLTGMAKKILPTAGASDDFFGGSVALAGDVAVVGALYNDDAGANCGAVYVFERDVGGSNAWGQVKTLVPSTANGQEYFGCSVAVDGDVIAVGARGDATKGASAGAAYVFERNLAGTNNWGQVAQLFALDAAAYNYFGASVAVAGDVVAVGATGNDTSRGAVYVFERNRGGANLWPQVQKLVASDRLANDAFGCSVAADGDVIVAGAYGCNAYGAFSGAAYVFERFIYGADYWKQVRKLLPPYGAANDMFGCSVAVDGDVAAVGAYRANSGLGGAFVFERNAGNTNAWNWVGVLLDNDGEVDDALGYSVAVAGDVVVAGTPDDVPDGVLRSGSAYAFERNAGGTNRWGLVQKFAAADGGGGDGFGCAVAIADGSMLVGALGDDGPAGDNAGSAYLYPVQPEAWNGTNKLVGNIWGTFEGADLGKSVAVAGDVIVAGAEGAGVLGADSGLAFVYERNRIGTNRWGLVGVLNSEKANGVNDYFGCSVAAAGETIAVGAYGDEGNGEGAGAAYLFQRNVGESNDWDKLIKLVGTDTAAGDHFGSAVAAWGDVVVAGAPLAYDNTPNRGSAYVFERNTGGVNLWGQAKLLRASDAAAEDHFGSAVAAWGDVVVVGAPGDDNPDADSGSAYVYERNKGGIDNWGMAKKLAPLASEYGAGADLGTAVAIAGDVVAIGAPFGSGVADPPGMVFVFERNAGGTDNWGQVAVLIADDAENGDAFGCSVAVAEDAIVVGAEGDEWPGILSMSGSAYVFGRHAGGTNAWGQMRKFIAHDAAEYDVFGHAVAADGAVIVAGAYGDDDLIDSSGAAYVFEGTLFGPPHFSAMLRIGGFSQMGFPAQPAWIYAVQWRTNLLNGTWQDIDMGPFFGDVDGFSVAAHQTDSPTAVYRVKRQGW